MTIIVHRPWTRQPSRLVGANQSNPLTQSLAMLVNAGASSVATDEGPRKVSITTNGAITRVATAAGLGYGGFSSSTFLSFANPVDYADTPASVFALLQNTSTANQGFADFGDVSSDDHMPYSGGVYTGALGSLARHCAVATSIDFLRPHTFAVARKAGTYGSAWPQFRTYVNGHIASTTTINTGDAVASTFWAGKSVSGLAYLGAFVLLAFWRRELLAAEIAALHANPWQLFAPRRIIIPVGAAAVTAPTLSDLRAINVGATSTQWSIDYTFS